MADVHDTVVAPTTRGLIRSFHFFLLPLGLVAIVLSVIRIIHRPWYRFYAGGCAGVWICDDRV